MVAYVSFMSSAVKNERRTTWYVGFIWPVLRQHKVIAIQADGQELEYIKSIAPSVLPKQYKNRPRVLCWSDESSLKEIHEKMIDATGREKAGGSIQETLLEVSKDKTDKGSEKSSMTYDEIREAQLANNSRLLEAKLAYQEEENRLLRELLLIYEEKHC